LWAVAAVDMRLIIPAFGSDFHRTGPRCLRHFCLF